MPDPHPVGSPMAGRAERLVMLQLERVGAAVLTSAGIVRDQLIRVGVVVRPFSGGAEAEITITLRRQAHSPAQANVHAAVRRHLRNAALASRFDTQTATAPRVAIAETPGVDRDDRPALAGALPGHAALG